ncbi:hypothetical protein ACM91H_18775 [Escherichia coli]|uniref:hypothetical protein n=1 Tax=Escherichia coli TaxID=562 RepID=UPI0001789D2C|nr:hypothetical protein [Escherichia coli]EDV81555.1 AatB [Escherichia coli E22]
MNFIKLMSICLASLTVNFTYADTFYGTLRGSDVLNLKSPYDGVILLKEKEIGKLYDSKIIFSIKNFEHLSKLEVLHMKISNTKNKYQRMQDEYKHSLDAYKKGYISKYELVNKHDDIKELNISLKELILEADTLENLIEIGKPLITKPFIIRDMAVSNNQSVQGGDFLMTIELLDHYRVDIKYDPASLSGRLQDKKIKFKSTVNSSVIGSAHIHKINSVTDGRELYGLKVASLILDTSIDLSDLIDTVFEITVDD